MNLDKYLSRNALRSASLQPSNATVSPSHIAPAPASSHQPCNSVFLSHHTSSSLPNAVIMDSLEQSYDLHVDVYNFALKMH